MDPRCPRCSDRPVLKPRELKGAEMLVCGNCRGILMTRADVDAVLALAVRDTEPEGTNSYFKRLRHTAQFCDPDPSLRCPHCRYDMYEVASRGLVIDFCINCEAIWFDHGELKEALRIAKEHGSLELVPADFGDSDTVALIGWMLGSLVPEDDSAKKSK